uniref:Uncharacterized protein n=1 Tax=Escherichia coli TaxID=562 RepID=C7SA09_ECOLX|nr:hypothetical protein YcdA [Escherichia coli]
MKYDGDGRATARFFSGKGCRHAPLFTAPADAAHQHAFGVFSCPIVIFVSSVSVKFPFPDSVSKSPGLNRCTSCHIEKQVWQVTGSSPSATFSQFSISTRSLLYCKL